MSLALVPVQIVLGRFVGGQHVARDSRVYRWCDGVAVLYEMHMIFIRSRAIPDVWIWERWGAVTGFRTYTHVQSDTTLSLTLSQT